jgi:hypothetical protein
MARETPLNNLFLSLLDRCVADARGDDRLNRKRYRFLNSGPA